MEKEVFCPVLFISKIYVNVCMCVHMHVFVLFLFPNSKNKKCSLFLKNIFKIQKMNKGEITQLLV